MSDEEAIQRGNKWRETVKTYKFISCKLIDNCVQPVPATKQVVNNTTRNNTIIRKSIF